jgi:hypothetical protein
LITSPAFKYSTKTLSAYSVITIVISLVLQTAAIYNPYSPGIRLEDVCSTDRYVGAMRHWVMGGEQWYVSGVAGLMVVDGAAPAFELKGRFIQV